MSNLIPPLTLNELDPEVAYEGLTYLLCTLPEDDPKAIEMIEYVESVQYKADPADHGPIVMNDPRVLEFVNDRNLGESPQELIDIWPAFTVKYTEGINDGIEEGYIPESVRHRLAAALTWTGVRIVDAAVMDTIGSMTAYYWSDRDEVGIRHDVRQCGETLEENLAHEVTHKISGGTFLKESSSEGEDADLAVRSRVGYSTELRPDVMNRTGFNEAVTQHVTLGVLTGDFETIDPDKREDGDTVYAPYRKVLSSFMEKAQGVIGVKTLTRGFFEDTDTYARIDERRRFVKEAVQAYGYGALRKIDKLFETTDVLLETGNADRLEELVLSRIHPPRLGAGGEVISKGKIDIDDLPTFVGLLNEAGLPEEDWFKLLRGPEPLAFVDFDSI